MSWRFWKKRTTVVTEAAQHDGETAIALDADTPRMGDFHFDAVPADGTESQETNTDAVSETMQSPQAAMPEARDVAAVVRQKARRSGRRPVLDLDALGVAPLVPPSLREVALLYREAARQRASKRPDESIELWQAYLDLTPADGGAWIELGQALLAAHRFEPAWGAFVEARQLDELDPLPVGALGYLSTRAGDHQAAAEHYAEAVRLSPKTPELFVELAEAQVRAGELTAAEMTRARLAELLGQAE